MPVGRRIYSPLGLPIFLHLQDAKRSQQRSGRFGSLSLKSPEPSPQLCQDPSPAGRARIVRASTHDTCICCDLLTPYVNTLMGATLKAGFATLPVNVFAYGCWLRLQHNRIVIVARITPVSSSKARRLYTRFRYSCSGISPRTFRSPLTPILKHTRATTLLEHSLSELRLNALQYGARISVQSRSLSPGFAASYHDIDDD
jgi:hypothetical protein